MTVITSGIGPFLGMTTIALVDDDEDSRYVLKALLEGDGHTVQQFTSGRDFLETFKAGAFKLILMDLSMPDMDGYELLRIVRSEDPAIPVLAVTASAYDADRKQARAAGFSDLVTKPFMDLPIFFDLIIKHLQAT